MPESMRVFQNALYIGINITCILYGVQLILYFMTVRALLRQTRKPTRSDIFFVLFSTALLLLNTISVATNSAFGQEMWVVNQDYPGGADAYLEDYATVWYQTFGTAAGLVLQALASGLLVYRCWVVCDDLRVAVILSVLWLGTFVLASLRVYASAIDNFFTGPLNEKLGTATTACLIGLNTILTTIICGRLYFFSRYYGGALGAHVGEKYTNAVAIIVESALPYTLASIVYLIAFSIHSQTSIVFLCFSSMLTAISPSMIILRVLAGRAWTRNTRSLLTSTTMQLQFATVTTTQFGESGGGDTMVMSHAGGSVGSVNKELNGSDPQLRTQSEVPNAVV
ncbi:hypothetical protein BV20DRAFT_332691 [Pilatotrama ljubarskyi]|nr:hypothetical protein BV20DRAFT_332691 [Pilatotrama ljubarskyi]